jgi:hypothetical protein
MATQMSITQGLAELKLLDKRIVKLVGKSDDRYNNEAPCFAFVDLMTKTKPVDTERFKKEALANYQSLSDLIKRRDAIKRAIIMANSSTQVKIGTWTGSVAEAIEQKTSIKYRETLIKSMKRQVEEVMKRLQDEKSEIQGRLDRLLSSEMGKDVKTNPDTVDALTRSFMENNKVQLIDPLDSSKLIATLEEEVEGFATNVDWVLSEINGKTMITV